VSDLLQVQPLKRLRDTQEDILKAVAACSKRRFQIIEWRHDLWVRAVQGFSRSDVEHDKAYRRLFAHDQDIPTRCLHGTYRHLWSSIFRRGLVPGGHRGPTHRRDIHFCSDEYSGMRSDCSLLVWLDLKRALVSGMPFFLNENGVILSPGNANGATHQSSSARLLTSAGAAQ